MYTLVRKDLSVKIKKLVPEAVVPTYAHPGDAGMDITCTSVEWDNKNECYMYHTGLAFEVPEGYVMLIFPRSSNRKTDFYLTNSVGVLDSGYRGELMMAYKSRTQELRRAPYQAGERIGQIMILPYPVVCFNLVDELSDTERGAGGFGSTGK